MKILKWNVYYLPRNLVEPNNKFNDSITSARPVIVLKKYKDNVLYSPITKTYIDESHIEIEPISRSIEKSFVKTSVIQTLSISGFVKKGQHRKTYKISDKDKENLNKEFIKLIFG